MTTSSHRQIALFGGSFDPPHRGHTQVASTLVKQDLVNEVWFLPVHQHPHHKLLSSDQDRLAMLNLVVTHPKWQICEYEFHQPGPSYSLQTLRVLAEQEPEAQFIWVMGSDQLSKFHTWWQYQDLLAEFPVWVYPRAGFPADPWYKPMRWLTEVPQVSVSSTQVRSLLGAGESAAGLVEPAVETYSKEHRLYVSANSLTQSESPSTASSRSGSNSS
jgi:nicotinate-nucleotide adenylyltransferase